MPKKLPIQLDDLFRLKVVGHPAVSPDGRCVVFELKHCDLKENKNLVQLMIVDVDTKELRELTSGKHVDTAPRWSPDGKRIAFLSNRDKGTCLFTLAIGGGEPKRLTEPDGFVHDFAWSPDGRRIVYAYQAMNEREKLERDGKHDEIKKRPQFKHITRIFHRLDGVGWWNGEYTHLWMINADSSKPGKPKQLTKGNYDDREPRFSPDGKLASFISNRVEDPDRYVENADIYVVKPSGGAIKKITQMPGPCAGHSWSPDGKSIAFVGSPAKAGQSYKYVERVWIVPSAGGKPREVTPEIDNNTRNLALADVASASFEVHAPIWSADSARLYFLVSEQASVRFYSRSIKQADLRLEVGGDVNVYHVQQSVIDGPIAFSIGDATNPGDIYVALPGDRPGLRRLTTINQELLDRRDVVTPESFQVTSDKVQVQGWVMRPPGFSAKRKYPAILQIHGGPEAHYGHSFFHELQWLCGKGYVIVFANPRGSTSYGHKYQTSIHANWGDLDYKDITRVADWLFARPYVDKKRIGVTGGSYGGYMTNWLIGHTNRFRAAVTQRSVVNLETLFGTSDYGLAFGQEWGGFPWQKLAAYRRSSPLTYVKNIQTPLLIEHEEEDHRCAIEQAEQLFMSLKALGRTVELVRFEGESHGLCRSGRPQNRAERLRRIAGWFDRYMPE